MPKKFTFKSMLLKNKIDYHPIASLGFLSLLLVFSIYTSLAQTSTSYTANKTTNLFIENKGQWPEEVLFLTQENGINAWITSSGVVYDFYTSHTITRDLDHANRLPNNVQRNGHVVKMQLKNQAINKQTIANGLNQQTTTYNYFKGNDPEQWISNVPLYHEVLLNDVYKNINMRYYYDAEGLRYDFIVQPGAAFKDIEMDLLGSAGFATHDTELEIQTSLGTFKQTKLYAYQLINGEQKTVSCKFIEDTDGSVRFDVGAYDQSLALIIDPLLFSSIIGGQLNDISNAVQVDWADNIIIAGSTESPSFPSNFGAYSITHSGNSDCFVSKLNAGGTTLLFSTFIGGSNFDEITAIALDNIGNIYFTGSSSSVDFPVSANAYDAALGGLNDAIVGKLNATGSVLNYSTYLGGNGIDESFDIQLDVNYQILVGGITNSAQFPTTAGAINTTLNGGYDLFITKLNTSFDSLIFSSYWGGSNNDIGAALGLSNGDQIIISGTRKEIGSSVQNPFIVKLNANAGTQLFFNSIGGSGNDVAYDLAIDALGNSYVCGKTFSSDFPVTSNAYDNINASNKGFIFKADTAGNLLSSTFFAANGTAATCIDLNDFGSVGLSGYAQSGIPVTTNAYDSTYNGGSNFGDVFFAKLDTSLSELRYATYLGGTSDEIATNFVFDHSNNPVITGHSESFNFPITSNAYGSSNNSAKSIFLTNLQLGMAELQTHPACFADSNGTIHAHIIGGGSPYTYQWSNGSTGQTATGLAPGVYTVTILDANNIQQILSDTVFENPELHISTSFIDVACFGESTGVANLSVSGGTQPYTYTWSNGSMVAYVPGLQAGTYSYTFSDAVNCGQIDTFIIAQPNELIASASITHCTTSLSADGAIDMSLSGGTQPYNYFWSNGTGQMSLANLTIGIYELTISDANACAWINSFEIEVFEELEVIHSVVSDVLCHNDSNGSISLDISGNYTPFSFLWSNGAQTQNIQNLPTGAYSVTITDTNLDEIIFNTVISQPDSLIIYPLAQLVQCNGDSAEVSIVAVGGTTPYIGAIDTFLFAGNYTFFVEDANGCSVDTSIEIIDPPVLELYLDATNASGENIADGAIDATAFGGVSPYSYSWSNGSTDQDLMNVLTGHYYLTLSDDVGCTVIDSAFIDYSVGMPNILAGNTVNVYPNPASKLLYIQVATIDQTPLTINFYDATGRQLSLLERDYALTNQQNITVDISSLPSGLYFYRIKSAHIDQVAQLIITN